MASFWQFLTFKWQFSRGSGPCKSGLFLVLLLFTWYVRIINSQPGLSWSWKVPPDPTKNCHLNVQKLPYFLKKYLFFYKKIQLKIITKKLFFSKIVKWQLFNNGTFEVSNHLNFFKFQFFFKYKIKFKNEFCL